MVEDYLTDREQEEALRNWWRDNWRWILGGVVLGLALLGGWQYWETYRTQRAERAAKVYAGLPDGADGQRRRARPRRLLNDLVADHAKSAYTQQGRLLLAKRDVEAGQASTRPSTLLRAVVDKSKDEELASIAQSAAGTPADPAGQA